MMPSMRQVIAVAQYGGIPVAAGLSPRFYLGTSPRILERQTGLCAANSHSCRDVNSTLCCPDTQYCIVDSKYNTQCCDIGSDCSNPCASSLYQCPSTTTVQGTATVVPACCPRSCPTITAFKCASVYGGGCCDYGSTCESGGNCRRTIKPTTSNAIIVSIIPSGCTTSQIACPTSIGGGCCDNGQSCTVVDNTNYCAVASGSAAVRTGPNGMFATAVAQTTNKGLSTGAKAGIGVGVAVGACLVLGLLTWFLIVHRRLSKQEDIQRATSVPTTSQVSGSRGSKSRPRAGRQRQPSDYFGPTAASGPFTESNASPSTSPGVNRGVPASPGSPGDIQVPVEIDSRNRSTITSPGTFEFGTPPANNNLEDLEQAKSHRHPVELP